MSKINKKSVVIGAIITSVIANLITGIFSDIITGIIGYINLTWVIDNKLIVGSVITGIAIVIIFIKKFSDICKFFNWLLEKYFKIIWKIIGMEKRFEEENTRLEIKFKEIKKQFEVLKNPFYHYLKEKYPPDSTIYVEISIKSVTFKKIEKGYKEDEFKNCKIVCKFNKAEEFNKEKEFQLVCSDYEVLVKFSEIEKWEPDKNQPDKINLHLNMAVVFDENEKYEKLKLEDFNKIWCCYCLGKERQP
jgi:hypothetical protein